MVGGLFLLIVLCQDFPAHASSNSQSKEQVSTADNLPELRLSLQDAMQAAVETNPSVQLSREQIQAAQSIASTRLGALLPSLSGNASYANRRFFLGSFAGRGGQSDPLDFYNLRAFLSQNLFSLSLIQQWRASRAGVEVSSLDSEVIKRDTMATVALGYLGALRSKEAVKARQANVTLNGKLLRLARERKAAGVATRLDVTRAAVQFKTEKQRLLVAENAAARSKLNLLRAMGLPYDIHLILIDRLDLVKIPKQNLKEALQVAKARRVELQAQQRRERLARLNLSSIRAERVPSLVGTGDVGLLGNQIPDAVNTHNVQVLMTIPIFDGGQREGRISESRSLVRQESIRTRDMQAQVALEVRDALMTLDSTAEQITVAQQGLQLSLKELNLAKERFSVGVVTNIEVTNAQNSLAAARDTLIEALFNFHVARVNLARAQGRLEEL